MNKCPRCGSHSPKLHPAVQLGGEVSICMDAFHGPLPETATDDPKLEAWLDDCWNDFRTRMKSKEILCSFNPELALTQFLRDGDEVAVGDEFTQADREAAFFVSRMFLGNHDPMPDQLRSGELKRHILLDVLRNHRLGGAQ